MTLTTNIPRDGSGAPVLALWDDATNQPIPVHIKSKVTGADGQTYALLDTGAAGGGGGSVADVVQTGTISADNGVVTAVFGAGVASWSVDARGTFSAGTTLIFEYDLDAGLDYNPAFGVPIGSTSDVAVSSVAGGAAISYQGNGAGFQKFRVRAHPFQAGDSIAVTIVGSVATDGGFVSKSLPPGTNAIGKVGIQVAGADVSTANPLPANILHGNLVDAGNSSTATLTANSVFTGTAVSGLNYSALALEAYADVASAAGGLQVLQSQDNVNFDLTDSFTVSAATAFNTVVNLVGQYYKVKYTNGGTNQATFRLQAIKQAAESVLPRTLTTLGNLKVALQEDNTAGLATQATLASILTGINTLVTDNADVLADGDNLATINTNTANSATGTGGVADSAATNSTSSWSMIALLKGLYALLVGVLIISRKAVSLFSTAQTTVGSGNSGDLTVSAYTEVSIDITTTAQAGTSPTIQFFWDRKGADGIYYPLWQSVVYTAAANTLSTSIGAGMAYNQSLGSTGRLRWVVTGTATPTWTFTPNVAGK